MAAQRMTFSVESAPREIIYGTTGVDEILQNVRMIITTQKGTVPLDREFGVDFSFLDRPIHLVQAKIEQDLFLAIRRYEPRARLRQIKWDIEPMQGRVSPTVEIEVVEDGV